MTLVSVIALTFAVAASVAPANRPANPTYMRPPAGWHSLGPPPPNAPIDYGWVSPHFGDGTPHAGDTLTVSVWPIPPNSTLADQVRKLTTQETQDGRTVASSHSHATCNGTQPGWTIDLRLQLGPTPTMMISQVYQIAVFKAHVYVINLTHRADLPIGGVVQASLDSLCPKTRNLTEPARRPKAEKRR